MRRALADLRTAAAFLTILPLKPGEGRKPGWAFAWFPLVGGVIGAALAGIMALPLAVDLRACLVLAAWVMLTGGLHLDGFADSCDALLAAVTPERRLEILKDVHAGTWAVAGLILLLLGKYAALRYASPLLLVAPPVVGRWVMVTAAANFPYARSSGLGAYFRDGLGGAQGLAASGIALAIVIPVGLRDAPPLLVLWMLAVIAVLLVARWAARRLGGGLTGDVYGALCELTELLMVWGLALWNSA